MHDELNDEWESSIRHFEKEIAHRTLTSQERAELERTKPQWFAYREAMMSPIEKHLRTIAFKKRLKARQGTISPDFAALYKKKAELDRKLLGFHEPVSVSNRRGLVLGWTDRLIAAIGSIWKRGR